MNRADVKEMYDRGDVAVLFAAASNRRYPEDIRHDAYWCLYVLDDGHNERARRAVLRLRAEEDSLRAKRAAKHGWFALHVDRQFSFDGRMPERHWWQRGT